MDAPRSSGILLHVTSLPGPYGIGDLGPAAYQWVDRLAAAGQSWWQFLPLGPTGYADSPYQCLSAFAGNPNLISLEALVNDGLLEPGDLPEVDLPRSEVDFDRVTPRKAGATERAFVRFQDGTAAALATSFENFCRRERDWLEPFALFIALKERHEGKPWWEWPTEHGRYDPERLARTTRELAGPIELHKFRQFLFFRQWQALRAYAHQKRVRFIGDMPIFVSADSVDVWSRPELFQLDKQRRPTFVAGVPPDYFSKTGQLWGNPLYAWDEHAATGYAWWIERLRATLQTVDLVRLDHFRGFEAYWAVPAGDQTAERGTWQPGPREVLFHKLKAALGDLPLIAEDLGVITPPVNTLRQAFKLPGMRILQFAFGGAQEDRFFPHNFVPHTVVYTGTHDNETTAGWYGRLTEDEKQFLDAYAPGTARDPAWALIRLAWASVAELAIAPLQDVLRLGNDARMNLPGTTTGNWRWRVDPALLTAEPFDRLAKLTDVYQRRGR